MDILNYKDVEDYLQNRQVYFKKEIIDTDFKTIAEAGKVHYIGDVKVSKLNTTTIVMDIAVDNKEISIYENQTDNAFFAWIKINMIPIDELVSAWENDNDNESLLCGICNKYSRHHEQRNGDLECLSCGHVARYI